MTSPIDRRAFLKNSLTAGLALTAAAGAHAAPAAPGAPAAPLKQGEALPQGRIGELKISRLILGGNLLSRYNHCRDLSYVPKLCAHYLTDEKILETLAKAEECGIDTLSVDYGPATMSLLQQHRKRGGKMKWIMHTKVPLEDDLAPYTESVRQLVDEGVDALYIWGEQTDRLIAKGKEELLAKAVEALKINGLPVGVGGHDLRVVEACERLRIPNDFYIKTFHHHQYPSAPRPDELKTPTTEVPGYWCQDPPKTIEVMKNVKKPWIAFKVMAAGAIPPESAFRYAFSHGADFVLAGMFDFEVAENTALIRKVLGEIKQRERPWLA